MTRKIIKTSDCFLNICLTISIENTNRYILGQKCDFHSGFKPFLCDWIQKKKIFLKSESVVSIVLIVFYKQWWYRKSNFN